MTNSERLAYVRRVDPGAIEEYEDRTLKKAKNARVVDVNVPAGIMTELGPVHAITYTGTLQGDTHLYEHTFVGDAQPDLMVDANNTLHIVGGDYHVADVGIVDGEGPMRRHNPAPKKSLAAIARLANQEGYKGSPKLTAKSTLKDLYFWLGFNGHQVLDPKDRKIEGFAPLTLAVAWQEVDEFSRRYLDYDRGISNPKEKPFSRAPLGSGGRFAACVDKMKRRGNVKDPKALCASIGRKKYGARKMASMAKAGRRNPNFKGYDPTNDLHRYVQLAEYRDNTLRHAWGQYGFEALEHSDGDLAYEESLYALLKRPEGEWVEVPGGGDFIWRTIPEHLIEFVAETEQTLPLHRLHRLYEISELPVGTQVLVTGFYDIDGARSLDLAEEPAYIAHPQQVGEIELELESRMEHLDDYENHLTIPLQIQTKIDAQFWDESQHGPDFEIRTPRHMPSKYDHIFYGTYTPDMDDQPAPSMQSAPQLTPKQVSLITEALRLLEESTEFESVRLDARALKGALIKHRRKPNPVVTNRVRSNSPVLNAGVLAAPLPGGYAGYNYPKVNAGALAVAMPAPSSLDYPGVVNGSHGLLGPRIRRSVPRQPLRRNNPHGKKHPTKKDLQWRRNEDMSPAGYELFGPNTLAIAFPYKPRSTPDGREFAEFYAHQHGQKVPTGTKWALITSDGRDARHEGLTAHKTLASAKRKGLQLIKNDWDNI